MEDVLIHPHPSRSAPRKSRKGKTVSILVPDISGGGMTRAYWLAKIILSLGHQVEILGSIRKGYPIYPLAPEGITVQPLEGESLLELTKSLFKKINGDVIYAIKPRPTSFGIALLHRISKSLPVILDIDDWELAFCKKEATETTEEGRGFFDRDFFTCLKTKINGFRDINHSRYLLLLERLVHYADAITTNNRFLQQRFGGMYIPSGKDTSLFDPKNFNPNISRDQLNLNGNLVIMFPGTPVPHKGLEDLLVGIEKLGRPEMKVVLVGGRHSNFSGTLMKTWPEWILHLPRYPLDDMPAIVSAAHIVAIPQRDVPIARAQVPMKLTDAMAMAKPILSTTVGDIPEVLGGTGYLVHPGNPEAIAEKLEWLSTHQQEANLKGWEARERCMENYSLEAVGPTLSQVLKTVT